MRDVCVLLKKCDSKKYINLPSPRSSIKLYVKSRDTGGQMIMYVFVESSVLVKRIV